MYITLTNAAVAHKGAKIAINTNLIATIHTTMVERGSNVWEEITYIFCPPYGTWEVSESHDHVVSELNKMQSSIPNLASLVAMTIAQPKQQPSNVNPELNRNERQH